MKIVLVVIWAALGLVAWFRGRDKKGSPDVACIFMGLLSIVYGPFMFFMIRSISVNWENWKPTRIDF